MSQTMLEGSVLTCDLLRATDLVCIVHLKDCVLTEADKTLKLLLMTTHLNRM